MFNLWKYGTLTSIWTHNATWLAWPSLMSPSIHRTVYPSSELCPRSLLPYISCQCAAQISLLERQDEEKNDEKLTLSGLPRVLNFPAKSGEKRGGNPRSSGDQAYPVTPRGRGRRFMMAGCVTSAGAPFTPEPEVYW